MPLQKLYKHQAEGIKKVRKGEVRRNARFLF
jgi:hypothetical protein